MPGGLLIHNLKSGSLDAELLEKLTAALGGPVSADIEELGEADNALNRARENHCDWVAVAGGDGTVEQVASTLIGATVPLGIVPVGTFNNFARSLDLPMDWMEACQVILAGNASPIDVGFANGKPFFECLGSGLDAALYPLSEEIKSGRIGRLADFLRRAYRYQRQRFVLTLDRPPPDALARISANESHRLREALMRKRNSCVSISALMLVVSNGPYFGMNFTVAPEQRMDERAPYGFGFQPLQQTSALVAFRLHCVWKARVPAKIHRPSRGQAGNQRPAKIACPPRWLSAERLLAGESRMPERSAACFSRQPLTSDLSSRLLLDLRADVQEGNCLASVDARQYAVPFFDCSELDQLGAVFQRIRFAPNGIRSRLGLHLGRIGLRIRGQLSLRCGGFGLRDSFKLFVFGLQCLLFRLHLGLDGAIELR